MYDDLAYQPGDYRASDDYAGDMEEVLDELA